MLEKFHNNKYNVLAIARVDKLAPNTANFNATLLGEEMNALYSEGRRFLRPTAWLLSAVLTLPLLTACGGGENTTPPPPVDNTRGGVQTAPRSQNPPQPKKQGLSTGQKIGITLVGAAALYYLYNQHKNKQAQGAQGKYYLSKNGRVYYRDAQGRPQWVTPPPGGIQVPEEQARQYRDFQGYNGRSTGRDLEDLSNAPVPAQ